MDLVNKASSQQGDKYEVFLSFIRGKDTQESFPTHLYSSLSEVGISVIKDDISIELLQSITDGSEISIIIFSKHYAGSRRCLEELTKIMEFHRAYGQVVIPIFYGVEPVEVRKQKFGFGAVFQDLIKRISPTKDEVSRWRMALNEAGCISGFIVPIFESRDEREIVEEVVENVVYILDKKDMFVADHPVGVENRVQEVITMIQNHQSGDVIMVGLWGMGGVGKTTIAKAIYNEIGRTFGGKSYLSEIRKVWNQEEGPVRLQNQLLFEILKTTNVKVNSVELGKVALRGRLRHKKALVVLDGVDKSAQLNALVGSCDWFGRGSIIIITTRDKHLLLEKNCHIYEMKNLSVRESIELFSWHAFKQASPKEGFIELSRYVVAYSCGLPLALEVLGSYLFDREAEKWKSVLEKLKKIPNDKIQKKLKISFDGLDDLEKEIFLDISCFFIGMDKNDVTQILNGCEFFAEVGITTLVEQSLITIDEKNKLGMHDLLQDMGREIIRNQSKKHLGNRSRLWFHEDAIVVLSQHMGTNAIEGLSLTLSQSDEVVFQTNAFKKMKRLRLLCFDNVQLIGDYKYISKELRWLCWHNFPLKYIPSNFYQKKLVVIDFQYSSLRQVWKEPTLLKKLKILNLSHSPHLMQTPDFSNLPNLEKLILQDCPSLSKINHSIGLLNQLLLLDLKDCIGLHSLPRSIYGLKCLKTLILSGCMNIEKLEEEMEQIKSLTTLIAPIIKQVAKPRSILWDMPISTHGPSTILSEGPKQQSLLLGDGLDISDSSCAATGCIDISKIENCSGHLLIQIGKNSQVFRALSERVSQRLNITKYSDDCILPGDNYPYWLMFKGEGASVNFKVPSVKGHDHPKGMTICCIYFLPSDLSNKACEFCIISLMIINYTKSTIWLYKGDKLTSLDEEREKIMSNLESDDVVEVVIAGNGFTVNRTAIYLIYNESFDEQIEPSIAEATNLCDTKPKCEDEEENEKAHQSFRHRKARKIFC